MVDKNFSFQSSVSDNYFYSENFSHSEIAKHYGMSSTKVKYIYDVESLNTSKTSWRRRCRRNILLFILMNLPPHKLKSNMMVMWVMIVIFFFIGIWRDCNCILWDFILLEDVKLQTW